MGYAKSVDEFFSQPSPFQKHLLHLREICLHTGMTETLKWGIPVYVAHDKNIAGICAFKSYFGIWFYQGALLDDNKNMLINAQEGKTVAMRQWRFTEHDRIDEQLILSYLQEAIENARSGREIKPAKSKPLELPIELKQALYNDHMLKQQFESLSISCKREYAEYIAEAKKEETRLRRLEKTIGLILQKKGLHDKYK